MKTFTIADIRSWDPCYDPNRYLAEDWSGTVLDLLRREDIPPQARLWVVLREELIDAKTLRLFAVGCCRKIQHLITDPRSIAAIDVTEGYANGQAADAELSAAEAAAWGAVEAAGLAAAGAAARDAAWAAACAAAWAAARDAARSAQVTMLIEMLEGEG